MLWHPSTRTDELLGPAQGSKICRVRKGREDLATRVVKPNELQPRPAETRGNLGLRAAAKGTGKLLAVSAGRNITASRLVQRNLSQEHLTTVGTNRSWDLRPITIQFAKAPLYDSSQQNPTHWAVRPAAWKWHENEFAPYNSSRFDICHLWAKKSAITNTLDCFCFIDPLGSDLSVSKASPFLVSKALPRGILLPCHTALRARGTRGGLAWERPGEELKQNDHCC